MGFWDLLAVASPPILQVLIISALGAFMATEYFNNLLSADTRKSLNKIVFIVFTPSLVFSSFAETVTLDDMISWWFMPVNVGFTFLFGGILGWIIVKLLKPNLKVEGLIIGACSSGNLGNLPIVIIPAICDEKGGPFGEHDACRKTALSYASFSMSLGGIFIWTYTYQLIHSRSMKFKALEAAEILKVPNKDLGADAETHLLEEKRRESTAIEVRAANVEDTENQVMVEQGSSNVLKENFWGRMISISRQLLEELMAPPTIATFMGFIFGGIAWLKNLIVGQNAPLRVIQDCIKLLGEGTIPCITLLLGGNLTQGLRSSSVKKSEIVSTIVARFIVLPFIGLLVVKAAKELGFLPVDPLFQYVLVMQYAMPPAMNISTMAQLFDVGQEECSVILLWTYAAAVIALTGWSTFLMWLLS
ncbi:hypothetical protein L6164_020273 [Bauhinia variegata]|uniref:Uncharacterized protein n=1 Tax=Bauhinia variegata TaxID=167791 RepID=A0ACB9MUZ9_BAUVA|nr:hypothetical protein L6164_020273 [Bauhinia variegata]